MSATLFAQLDACLGPVPMLSLSQRGLLLASGRGVAVAASPELQSRVEGALVGAAVGHLLGYVHEWRGELELPIEPRPGTPVGAEIELLIWSAGLLLEQDLGAAPALAERLRHALPMRRMGNALPAVLQRLAHGSPWFEAGVASHGSGAVVRAIAAGVVLRERPEWRPILAGLDASVTHASVEAVSAAAATAELVSVLLAIPGTEHDPVAILDAVIGSLEVGPGRQALELAREQFASGGPAPASGARARDVLAAAAWHALVTCERLRRRSSRPWPRSATPTPRRPWRGRWWAQRTGSRRSPSRGDERWSSRSSSRRWPSASAAELQHPCLRLLHDSLARGPQRVCTSSFLLDRSGSMASIKGDVIGGFNDFLEAQQAQAGDCRMTLAQFDSQDPFELLAADQDVCGIRPLDAIRYQPRSGTPLLDAFGSLLDHAEGRARVGRDEDQVVVVFSDGEENASIRWTREALFGRIERLKAAGWAFVFLGANQDSYAAARSFGIGAGNVSNWESDGPSTRRAFKSVSRSMSSLRSKTGPERERQKVDFFEGTKEAETDPYDETRERIRQIEAKARRRHGRTS